MMQNERRDFMKRIVGALVAIAAAPAAALASRQKEEESEYKAALLSTLEEDFKSPNEKLIEMSNKIFDLTRRGQPNWISLGGVILREEEEFKKKLKHDIATRDLVSVQPMDGDVALEFYRDIVGVPNHCPSDPWELEDWGKSQSGDWYNGLFKPNKNSRRELHLCPNSGRVDYETGGDVHLHASGMDRIAAECLSNLALGNPPEPPECFDIVTPHQRVSNVWIKEVNWTVSSRLWCGEICNVDITFCLAAVQPSVEDVNREFDKSTCIHLLVKGQEWRESIGMKDDGDEYWTKMITLRLSSVHDEWVDYCRELHAGMVRRDIIVGVNVLHDALIERIWIDDSEETLELKLVISYKHDRHVPVGLQTRLSKC